MILLNDIREFNSFLSSGTIRGINLIELAILTIQYGGYLIVDELEKHLNKELIKIVIYMFMNQNINDKGVLLIFSTHYPELIDFFERKVNLYLLVSNKDKSKLITQMR